MNKYTNEILIEALNELDTDDTIMDDDNDICIDSVMDDCYGESIVSDEPIF